MRYPGFILTRRVIRKGTQSQLEFWLHTKQGPLRLLSDAQPAVFFTEQASLRAQRELLAATGITATWRNLTLKDFQQTPLCGVYFAQPFDANKAATLLKNAGFTCYEADIRLADRYLMERFVYASALAVGQAEPQSKHLHIARGKLQAADYQPDLQVMSLDIECSGKGELFSIGLVSPAYQVVLMIGQPEPAAPEWIRWVEDEKALLIALCEEVAKQDPDVFIGWSVVNFDFALLVKRAKQLKVPLTLGRDEQAIEWRTSQQAGRSGFVHIAGRVVVDGIEALKTATYQFDSFSLESVAQQLLGRGKLSEDVDNRLAHIEADFKHNKVRLAAYNREDCQLVLDIFAHTKLLDFLILRSKLTGLELDRPGGSVAAFINLYLPKLHRAGYVAPNRPDDGGLASPGGYVMNSRPGLYQQVLVLDFKSLYPSIIRTFKIDPYGLIVGLQAPENAIDGFRGAYFSRDQHFLPDIITSLWQQRDQAKQQQDQARSQAIKILMNSFYGVLGSGGCPFYDTRLASSITLRGHQIMQQTAAWIEDAGYQVIYGDTDSTFVWLEASYSHQQAMEIGEQLANSINQQWQQKLADDWQLECHLEIQFESYFSQFIMPTIRGSEQGSKKRYVGERYYEQQGSVTTELVFKGLESVRSDWTPLAKTFQRELVKRVFARQDVAEYVRTVLAALTAGELDAELVYRKRLRQKLSQYVKNVPPQVKAARLADEHNQRLGKPLRYQHKGSISYVITLDGPQAVEYLHSRLDYQHYIDKQLKPVADSILHFIGLSFDSLTARQLTLF